MQAGHAHRGGKGERHGQAGGHAAALDGQLKGGDGRAVGLQARMRGGRRRAVVSGQALGAPDVAGACGRWLKSAQTVFCGWRRVPSPKSQIM